MTTKTLLIPFENSPFPLRAHLAEQFFDHRIIDSNSTPRRGRNSPRGGLYWEDITYSDNRVLVAIPPSCRFDKSTQIILYFHGNQATLEKDVLQRQQIPAQIADANINAILIAPQFAVNALDSSVGNFADAEFFTQFLDECARKLALIAEKPELSSVLQHAKVILVAYSGGYNASAHVLMHASNHSRVAGVILMDALYDHEGIFSEWIRQRKSASFFLSVCAESTRDNHQKLTEFLTQDSIAPLNNLPQSITANVCVIHYLNATMAHEDLMTSAWQINPLSNLLRRIK